MSLTMTDPVRRAPAPPPTATAAEFVATFAVILATIVGLLFMDTSLARVDQQESRATAADLYAEGRELLARGDATEASDRFASALAMERSNTAYARALAQALLEGGRREEAERTLKTLLERAESDGAANLTMARLLVEQGRVDDAKSYYHRAIYGRWGPDSAQRRLQSRLELIDLLARRHDDAEMLAELLPLEASSTDQQLRRRLGHLFIQAGSPSRGAAILRTFLRDDPNDADAYAGMGDAALALGNFRTARADLLEAQRIRPNDSTIARRLAIADTVLALDPDARGVDLHDRYLRRRMLLVRVLAELQPCGALPEASAATLDSARASLASALPPLDEERAGEAMVLRAAQLWNERPAACGANDVAATALGLVLDRLLP
jgi:Flp pilus assembly protein TadD